MSKLAKNGQKMANGGQLRPIEAENWHRHVYLLHCDMGNVEKKFKIRSTCEDHKTKTPQNGQKWPKKCISNLEGPECQKTT